MISITVRRPVYCEATSSDAPNKTPGNRNAGAQITHAGKSTDRKRGGFMPIMPATAGITGRSGPIKRPAITLLAPCLWKKCVPRSINSG